MSNTHAAQISSKQRKKGAQRVTGNATRPSSAGANLLKTQQTQQRKSNGSPIMQKLTALFRRERNTENGHVPVRPSCFAESPERRRSESPEPTGSGHRKRSTSLNNKKLWQAGKSEGGKGSGVGWRPKGRMEWESGSGHQITIGDVAVNELSKVEYQAIQRLAITMLQGLDIPVSHGLLKGSRNVFQRLSFNTFKQRRVNGNEKIVEGPPGSMVTSGVFGQPLNQVVSQDQPTGKLSSVSGSSTPVPATPTSVLPHQRNYSLPTSISPTSISSSDVSFVDNNEVNSTSMLLEALNVNQPPLSPKAVRRMSLWPVEPQVPTIVTKAINYLDTKGVKTEGLFRISGAKSRISEIREKFDSGEDVELTDDINPHDVACLLKEFFRSLPEPLMTVDLFGPFLSTRKLSNSAQRRDALRLLCLLLPQPNRDTLQELLEFLSRVALHSDGIILIDGTEEVGNRMTEENLAMILGPNILHKDVKRKFQKPTDFQVQKQDPEELNNVCKVMEDLIRMHLSIFVIPARLYDDCLRSLLTTDAAAVHLLLKRRCREQGLFLDESPCRGMGSRSRSTEALRKISQNSASDSFTLCLEQELREQELREQEEYIWQRTHSLSNTQKVLDEAIKGLEEYAEDLDRQMDRQRHYSSNDSAMCGSEAIVSPVQSESAYSEPSTLNRKRQVFDSMDSAFSNNSSPTNSSEGMHHSDIISVGSDSTGGNHIRMSSEASNTSATSPIPPPQQSPEFTDKKSPQYKIDSHTLPKRISPDVLLLSQRSFTLPSTSTSSQGTHLPVKQTSSHDSHKKSKHKSKAVITGVASYQHSPILRSKDHLSHHSETQLDTISSDHTPTESVNNITSSPSGYSLDSNHLHGLDRSSVI